MKTKMIGIIRKKYHMLLLIEVGRSVEIIVVEGTVLDTVDDTVLEDTVLKGTVTGDTVLDTVLSDLVIGDLVIGDELVLEEEVGQVAVPF